MDWVTTFKILNVVSVMFVCGLGNSIVHLGINIISHGCK